LKIVALAGGVGGARMVHGLAQVLPDNHLTVIVNVGDDFEHCGLKICPDLDTVCYTLAGLANPITGWGRKAESWQVLNTIRLLGGPSWFNLGDLDLAVHLERTRRLQDGQNLSQITRDFCKVWEITTKVLPATDDQVQTKVLTKQGELPFQEYFVKLGCKPEVQGFRFEGINQSTPSPGVFKEIATADVILLCPSNPWVSLDPILNIPGITKAIKQTILHGTRCVAVSPLIGGKAFKGPAAKMFTELGYTPSAFVVALHYREILTDFIFDNVDRQQLEEIKNLNIRPWMTDILMRDEQDRKRFAEEVISYL
jgi:LPPG:FO 2-phospho-L-lactate transferase